MAEHENPLEHNTKIRQSTIDHTVVPMIAIDDEEVVR